MMKILRSQNLNNYDLKGTTSERIDQLTAKYKEHYANDFIVIEAPGRINIIGEHTDYNGGYVLPAAIDKSVLVIIGRNSSTECHISAVDLNEEYSFSIFDTLKPIDTGWVNYFIGVLAGIKEDHTIKEGFNMMFSSSIPVGSGLSSSAAIECGFGHGVSTLYNLNIDLVSLAKIGQMAEHIYAGVKCGIMDQFAVVMGKQDQVIQLDCRSLDFQHFPAQFGDYELVLFDTQVKHNLASSEYNIRRAQCEEGVEAIKGRHPEVNSLRDSTLGMLDNVRNVITKDVYKRCRYVIEENERVLSVCEELKNNNIDKVGELMYETHKGLSDNYEVSCAELDLLVELAKESGKIIGSRMMGGGFGGCTINLVESKNALAVVESINADYQRRMNKEIKVYPVSISEGVHLIET